MLGELGQDAIRVGARLIHLVDGHHDGDLGGLGVVDGFDGLRHDAVVGGDHQDCNVGTHCAAGAHRGEGRVARGVQEGDRIAVDADRIGADVLGDAAGLARDHVRLADGVEEARLAVVDVAHDHDDGGTGDQLFGGVLVVVKEALLDRDHDFLLYLAAELGGDVLGGVKVDVLVDGGHDAVLDQALDDLGGGLLHPGGQLAHGDLVGDLDGERGLLDGLQTQTAQTLALVLAGLGALAALLLLVLVADLLLAAGPVLVALGDQGVGVVVEAGRVDLDRGGVHHAALALALGLGGLLLGGLLRAGLGILGRSGLLVVGLGGGRGLGGHLCLGLALCGLLGLLLLLGFLLGEGRGEDRLHRSDLILLGQRIEDHV